MAELLRACARKRKEQAGAPFDLHPATRKMLQDEVMRLAPRMKQNEARASFLPRFILGAAAFASVVICAVIVFHGGQPGPESSPQQPLASTPGKLNPVLTTSNQAGPGSLVLPPDDALKAGAPAAPASAAPATSGLLLSNVSVDSGDLFDSPARRTFTLDGNALTMAFAPAGPVPANPLDDQQPVDATAKSLDGANFTLNSTGDQSASGGLLLPQPAAIPADAGSFVMGNISPGARPQDGEEVKDKDSASGTSGRSDATASDAEHTAYIQNKLDHIILPSVEFHDVPLREAIQTLQQKSVQLDTTETDPARKGVNIVLKLDSVPNLADLSPALHSTKPGAGGSRGAVADELDSIGSEKITLSLKQIPLSEALRSVTTLAGLKTRVDPYAVTIVPLAENTEVLVTREYAVPDGFLNVDLASSLPGDEGAAKALQERPAALVSGSGSFVPATPAAAAEPQKLTAIDFLKSSGVPFPPGASANYSPSTGKLVVRNTTDNLDLVQEIVNTSINSELARETVDLKKMAVTKAMQAVAGKVGGPALVLCTFQLQMEGDVIRIIDSDGSIYSGRIAQPFLQKVLSASNGQVFTNIFLAQNQAAQFADADSAKNETFRQNIVAAGSSNSMVSAGVSNASFGGDAKRSAQSQQQQQANFSFRATGINRRLKAPVIFEGNYVAATVSRAVTQEKAMETQAAEQKSAAANTNTDELKQAQADKAQAIPEEPARIEGQAQVGEDGTITIDAVAAPDNTNAGPGK